MKNAHPNATTAGGTGGAGLVVVWLLGRAGITLSAEEGGAIAAGAATLALLIGRNGVKGLARAVWKGKGA